MEVGGREYEGRWRYVGRRKLKVVAINSVKFRYEGRWRYVGN
jgi:hypothetical protein